MDRSFSPRSDGGQGARSPARRRYAALLRAVNLGGVTQVDLGGLAQALGRGGMRAVRSVLNSGNFLLESDLSSASLEELIERVVTAATGRPATCLVRTAESCSRLLRSNPFPEVAESTPALLTVAFLKRAPPEAAWASLKGPWPGGEKVEPFGTHAFVHYPQGQGRSKLTVKVLESRLGVALTVRNWNTLRRLEALL